MRSGPGRTPLALALWALLLPLGAAGQAPVPLDAPRSHAPVEAIPDPARPAPAVVPYVHPLYRPVDQPPKLVERQPPADYEGRTLLAIAVKIDSTGRVADMVAVEPPLRGIGAQVPPLVPRWTFDPAKKDGRPVATWATFGMDMEVELDKATWASFTLQPLGAEEPLAKVVREAPGDQWMLRYPKDVEPRDGSVVSIEDVDFLPAPKKTPWKSESTRLKSRLTALVLVSPAGQVARIVPTGTAAESLAMTWLRQMAAKWKLTPALSGGKPVESWMVLDASLEYDLADANDKSKRMFKKNLRAFPK